MDDTSTPNYTLTIRLNADNETVFRSRIDDDTFLTPEDARLDIRTHWGDLLHRCDTTSGIELTEDSVVITVSADSDSPLRDYALAYYDLLVQTSGQWDRWVEGEVYISKGVTERDA